MLYEIELVRIDDAFDILEIEANTSDEAVHIAIEETILFDDDRSYNFTHILPSLHNPVYGELDQWRQFKGNFIENWSDIQYLCKKIIIRDETGKKLY